ncbi:MAG: non-homologous end-joining DNA ligase [Actinomycetota bacterium]
MASPETMRVGKRTFNVTNRDKVLFPEDGITKGDLIEYYAAIAPKMLPHVRNHPLTMERFPDGINGEGIMHKNIPKYFPDWVARSEQPKKGGTVTYVLANEAATLAYLAQQASITQHIWLSTHQKPYEPDVMIVDLDPTTEDFSEVREAALLFRSLFEELDLVPYVKVTGSRGLHVAVPIRPKFGFDVVHEIAVRIAQRAIDAHPDLLTMEFYKAKRGERIFADVHRNGFGATAVAPYSVRPRNGAPVAAPLGWDEVSDHDLRPDGFTMKDALERPDHWKNFRASARGLARTVKQLGVET